MCNKSQTKYIFDHEFKPNVGILLNNVIKSMRRYKFYITDVEVDSDYDYEYDYGYVGEEHINWYGYINDDKKFSFLEMVDTIEIGDYLGAEERLELVTNLFNYLVKTTNFWQYNNETKGEFRNKIYTKLLKLNKPTSNKFLLNNNKLISENLVGRGHFIDLYNFESNYYIKMLQLQCSYHEKKCVNISTSIDISLCSKHQILMIADKKFRLKAMEYLSLPPVIFNIISNYLPIHDETKCIDSCTIN